MNCINRIFGKYTCIILITDTFKLGIIVLLIVAMEQNCSESLERFLLPEVTIKLTHHTLAFKS